MGTKKQFQGHGDPLLREVVKGLKKCASNDEQSPELIETLACCGEKGVGERHFCNGDPLFNETERYHKGETDHVMAHAHNVAQHEGMLKRRKHDSLFDSHYGAFYDPILQEYVLPHTSMTELKALEEDVRKKRMLFREMSVRKRKNLSDQELLCDPLVHSYRLTALMFNRGSPPAAKDGTNEEAETTVPLSTYRKLNAGDPLLTACAKHSLKTSPPVRSTYRKNNAGDPLFGAVLEYKKAMKAKAAVPCQYRKMSAGDPLLLAVME